MTTTPSRLTALETIIAKGQQTFVDVGLALAEIRDGKLYAQNYKTFEEYCRERWGWTRQYSHQLIQGAAAVKSLPEKMSSMLDNARQAEALSKVPEEKRAQVIEVASQVAQAEERPMTARDIKEAAEEEFKVDEEEPPRVTSHPEVMRSNRPDPEEFKKLVLHKWHQWMKQWAAADLPTVRTIVHELTDRA